MNEIPQKKILIVEDDPFMVDLLDKELEKTGAKLILAGTGSDGVEKFNAEKPDIVILDLFLPDLDGFGVLRAIRRADGGTRTKVIILSNIAEEANIEEAKRLGVDDYMIKANFSLDEIVERVKKYL